MTAKKRHLSKNGKLLLAAALMILLLAGSGIYYLWVDSQRIQENVIFTDAYDVEVVTELLPSGTRARSGEQRRIKYIVIHETDNYGKTANAYNHSQFLLNNPDGNSWHYTVDDSIIYHHIPDNEIALHAGDYQGNKHGIGIELCVNEGSDFEATFDNAARLTARLLKAYDLPINAIKQHYDFSGKDCPKTIRADVRFDEFIALVKQYLQEK